MITKITQVLAAKGVNIENMLNTSKKQYAYTLLDVTGDITDDIANEIAALDDIIRVRVI